MGDHADDAMFAGLDQPWGYSRRDYFRRSFTSRPAKKSNAQTFAAFARDGTNFKAGDRVVHIPSGTAGLVISVRGSQILWRPDARLKPGGIYVDADKFRFDI